MALTPQDFVSKWKRVTARKKQIYQEHFIDLCHLIGHQTRMEYDPSGTRFGHEFGAGGGVLILMKPVPRFVFRLEE